MSGDQFKEVAEKLKEYCRENNYMDLEECFRVQVQCPSYRAVTWKDAAGRFAELAQSSDPRPIRLCIFDNKKNGYLVIEASLAEGKWEIEYSFEQKAHA